MTRPKNANGNGGVYPRQLSDGSTVYDVRWSYRDPDGRLRRGVEKGFTTCTEADRHRRKVTSEVDTRTFLAPHRRTFGEHLSDHLAHSPHEPQTLSGDERLPRLHILTARGHLRLSDVTPDTSTSSTGAWRPKAPPEAPDRCR